MYDQECMKFMYSWYNTKHDNYSVSYTGNKFSICCSSFNRLATPLALALSDPNTSNV